MKHYAIVRLDVTDPGWIRDYVAAVTPLVARHGGRYLARTDRVERWEGDSPPPQIVIVIEWPSREAAESFYRSSEYRPHLEARRGGSAGEILLVAGHDMAAPLEAI